MKRKPYAALAAAPMALVPMQDISACARTSDTFDTFGTLPVARRRRHSFRKIRMRQ